MSDSVGINPRFSDDGVKMTPYGLMPGLSSAGGVVHLSADGGRSSET